MPGQLSLGVDIGTTNVKACVLDTSRGRVLASAAAEHPLHHPHPGWAEQDPEAYWTAVTHCIAGCLEQYPGPASDVVGVSISGLVGVTLPVDRTGRPLRQAMIWMDSRSEAQCRSIRERVGERRIQEVNGNRVAPWFIEPKALWLREHEPDVLERTHKLLSPAGFCTMRLTGEYAVNHGDAGLFYPYDHRQGRWDHALTEALGLPPAIYPDIHSSDTVIGTVTAEAARETGLAEGTAVVAGGTDIGAAALGAGATEAGQAYYSMGTGSNLGVLIPRGQPLEEYRILKWPHVLDGMTLFDAPMAFTGASLKWFRDKFADPESVLAERMGRNVFDLVTAQAEQVSPGADGLLYLPYLGNSLAPRWDGNASGVFFGVQPFTSRAHVIRALIEGVAFDLHSNVRIADEAGADFSEMVLNGGPTKSALWNRITANVTGRRLLIPDVDEAAPLGDAVVAASGAGLYRDMTEPMKHLAPIRHVVEPDPELHEMYGEFFDLWERLYRDLEDSMARHHALVARHSDPAPSQISGAGSDH
ncbi:xylulokinase [Streptomyces oceani]|uniref:Sugar kinase n=1 Tax=Streptomyces oceani TaxID=1075402 RepID=A0A1E7JZI0_9ACTN|nr:FGGY family carbohydrate kinase [Streptomyces oceani]OEU97062.1 sugar kinase [Streptomyces oceani]